VVACKPNSVSRHICRDGNHLSGQDITVRLMRSTRLYSDRQRTTCMNLHPVRFTSHLSVTRQAGELLPHLFTLTPTNLSGRYTFCCTFWPRFARKQSGSPGFPGHGVCRCSDFPPRQACQGDYPATTFHN
jgi:hypothetical protein